MAIDLENDVQYVSMCPQCYFKAKRRAFYAEKLANNKLCIQVSRRTTLAAVFFIPGPSDHPTSYICCSYFSPKKRKAPGSGAD